MAAWLATFLLLSVAMGETSNAMFRLAGKAFANDDAHSGLTSGDDPAARLAAKEVLAARSGHATPGHPVEHGPVRDVSSTVPTPPPGWTITSVHIDSDGESRYYLLAKPTHVTASHLPVLVVLAGRDMTPAHIEKTSGFLGVVGQAVVVYPDGYKESWNAGYCCGAAQRLGVNDVAFIEAVVRSVLASQRGTSAGDVYLTGFSNGGRMAFLMACDDPRSFAGIAAVEAVAVSSCPHAAPQAVLEVAQTGDPLLTIPLDGRPKHIAGRSEITVDALVDQWRAHDDCRLEPHEASYATRLTVYSWSECTGSSEVSLAVYRGGKHRWPQGGHGTPSAQQLIWSFFNRVHVHP